MTFDVLGLLGILTSVVLLYLATWSWWSGETRFGGKLFAGLCFVTAWWSFWIALSYTPAAREHAGLMLSSQVLSGFFGPLVFLFALSYAGKVHRWRPWMLLVLGPGLAGTLSWLGTWLLVSPERRNEAVARFFETGKMEMAEMPAWFTAGQVVHSLELLGFLLASSAVVAYSAWRGRGRDKLDQLVLSLVLLTFLVGFVCCRITPLVGGADYWPRVATLTTLPFAIVLAVFLRKQGVRTRRLRDDQETLLTYLPTRATEELMSDASLSDGRRIHGVVLFADLRSFSTLSEQSDPQHLVLWMDQFFQRMSTVILETGGMVDKLMGDAVLAVFGVPSAVDEPEGRALAAAAGMLAALEELNRELALVPGVEVRMGIGIHEGPLMAGTVGSDRRRTYTVFGETVNQASRIEQYTKVTGDALLVSDDVVQRLPRDLAAACQPVGPVELRGVSRRFDLYRIAGDQLGSLASWEPSKNARIDAAGSAQRS